MDQEEDLLPRSKTPIAHPEPSDPKQYLWVDCPSKGWQVLTNKPLDFSMIPDPPPCVMKSRRKSKSGSPRRNSNIASPQKISRPNLNLSPHVADDDTENSRMAEKNFVLSNIRNTCSPKRHTRSALLEQAASQLRESELVSASLAERLNIIQTRLKN